MLTQRFHRFRSIPVMIDAQYSVFRYQQDSTPVMNNKFW